MSATTTPSNLGQAARADFDPPRDAAGRFVQYRTSPPESGLGRPGFSDDDTTTATTTPPAAEPGSAAAKPEPKLMGALRAANRLLHERSLELILKGYLPASSTAALTDPRSREGIELYWANHYQLAEQAGNTTEGVYQVMPDDYTPGRTSGQSLSGHRRTHRMSYSNSEVALRMPSATAIRRFSSEQRGATFDVPVEGTYPGGSVAGYVRVTNNGPGQWSVSGLNMDPRANAYISESVQAVLEARSVTSALRNVPDLLERRAQRLSAAGAFAKPLYHSDWIRSLGYNRSTGDMVVQINGKMYGYRNVAPETVERMRNPTREDRFSAGTVYNALVKGKHNTFAVARHDACGRFYRAGDDHRCPSEHKPRQAPETASSYQKEVLRRLAAKGRSMLQ